MVTYKQLNTTHQDYDADQIDRLKLLYTGGYEIQKHAKTFLPKLISESDASWKDRLKCSAYMPYMSQFVNFFTASLFSAELSVREAADAKDKSTLGSTVNDEDFYKLFSSNVDLQDTTLHNFLSDTFCNALQTGFEYVGVDMPALGDNPVPETLAEEEALGLNTPYLYKIDPKSVQDWCLDKNGKFIWVKMRNELFIQPDPLSEAMKQLEFKIWTIQNGKAFWTLYRSEIKKLNYEWRANDEFEEAEKGPTSFTAIPVHKLVIPTGLALGNKLGTVVEEYYQRRSMGIAAQNKACVAIPVVIRGPEFTEGSGINQTQQDPNRGSNPTGKFNSRGWVELGAGDDLKIVEATGTAHALLDKQLQDLAEQMMQMIHQMGNSAKNNTVALGRSGDSKAQDRHSTEILLTAYARVVKDFTKEIFKCISTARQENVIWNVSGLSTFVEEDREQLVKEVMALPLINIPSKTFTKIYYTKCALSLVGTVSPETEQTIVDEIESGIDSDEHKAQTEEDLLSEDPPKKDKTKSE
jgi:hypothetical protein